MTNIYTDVLDRDPDALGLAYWTSRLDAGTSRAVVAASILYSTEYRTDVLAGTDGAKPILGIYPHYLARAADQAGVNFWIGRFASGTRDEDVVAGFVASPEFYLAAQAGAA